MQMKKKFRSDFHRQNPWFIIAGLVMGAMLAVGGSVLATTVGNSISVTGTLTVDGASTLTGNTGVGTTTAGTIFSVQGVGNFVSAATSTLYTPFLTSNLTATSSVLLATNTGLVGVGTTSPGSLFSVQGVGNWAGGGSTVYSTYTFPSFTATSTTANNGVGTSTPGTRWSVQGVANYVDASTGTSTIYSTLRLPSFSATSTIATTTISTGGFQVGQAGALAAFTVGSSATTSVGVGTSTVPSHQFAVAGNALIGGTVGTTTLSISSSEGIGSCIQMRAASSSDLYRIYLGKTIDGTGSTTGLTIEQGSCR